MLGTSKLIGFVATARPAEARRFYVDVRGSSLVEDTPFALILRGNGTTLRIQKVQPASAGYPVLGWEVADIRNTDRGHTRAGFLINASRVRRKTNSTNMRVVEFPRPPALGQ